MKYIEFIEKYESITNNELIDKILWMNGIKNIHDYKKINTSSFPFYFSNQKIFNDYINKHSNITIIGDYDCDGVCATTIMMKFLTALNKNCNYIIGDRFIDGYGMNNNLVDKAKALGTDLIITVDNGIKCKDSVGYAKTLGMDVLVTDHHEVEESMIPECEIFNPHYKCDFEFEEICGAFVALMLIIGYNQEYNFFAKDFIYELYELAAIATIGDVMPLYDINRKIVTMLTNRIANDVVQNEGLKKLIYAAKANSAVDLAYNVVPIINAPGRIDKANIIIDILIGKNNDITTAIELNNLRKELTKKGLEKIIPEDEKINVLFIPNLNEGILGILAGNIKEKTNKPTFIFTNGDKEEIKGSGRSVAGFNILNATEKIIKNNNLFTQYGGHEGAMGLTLKNIDAFYQFKKLINKENKDAIFEATTNYITLPFSIKEASKAISMLEPIGQGLSIPLLKIEGKPCNIKIINDLHTQFQIKTTWGYESFIAFNKIIQKETSFYFTINKSEYMGKEYYKGNIIEAK